VVVGQFKRGKTSPINALLGADILPVAVVPLTSIVTIMTYGEALRIEKRLEKSKLDFRWEMLQRIEATVEGISTAIDKGMNQRSKGEKDVERRKKELGKTAQRLEEIMGRLMKTKEQVDQI